MPAQSGFTILAEAILPPLVDQDLDFLGGSDGKASAYNAGDPDLIPGLGIHGAAKSRTRLSDFTFPKLTWFFPFLGSLMGIIVLPLFVSTSG